MEGRAMRSWWIVGARGLALMVAASGWAWAGEPSDAQRRAEAIVKRAEEASLREFAPAYRARAVRALAALPAAELEARETRDASRGLLVPGDSSAQLVYTKVAPCRIVDTRLGGGALQPGIIRNFKVAGSGLGSQGGATGGCNVPVGPATAAVINFVAVNPTGAGNLRAWAYSTPPQGPPGSSIINYTTVPGATLNLANGIVVPLCDAAQTSCPSLDLRVQADVSATHLVADVVGYFERFPKEQLRTFSEVDNSSTPTTIGNNCTHVTGADVTLVAPVAGKVVVRASVPHRIQQNNGGDRVLILGIAESDNDCNFTNFAHSKVKNDTFTEDFLITVPVMAVFDVAPGTYNYFLNGEMTAGAGNAVVVSGVLIEATFHPN
jgi:hypothetical protein